MTLEPRVVDTILLRRTAPQGIGESHFVIGGLWGIAKPNPDGTVHDESTVMPSPSDAAATKLTDLVHRARASVTPEVKPAVGRPVEPEPTVGIGRAKPL
ncbi:uncharacterized protein N7498_008246 [Penicillium cinerascens]|uniref:Uncharacterized protein n=1 Tax=Penicillium cinerascens TaxID=70096 RepID=A0A9W9JDG5_9EURO|nr:uncharacterized protein N7498_008246 [Penicillium cinerascens]KAJ5194808.1 hypothetical protein N7498_008246 [Penicillium cinerascens]